MPKFCKESNIGIVLLGCFLVESHTWCRQPYMQIIVTLVASLNECMLMIDIFKSLIQRAFVCVWQS